MSNQLVRIATRASPQAQTQAEAVAAELQQHGYVTELVFVETLGDRSQSANTPLHSIGGQGVFVKEVQKAVLDGQADIAVHSAKDLPSLAAEGLVIGAFCARRDARDALIGSTLDELALGATVATGSVRRRAQLRALRPDLRFVELRGNIHTRLSKVPPNGALVMAVAALQVLGLTDQIAQTMDADDDGPCRWSRLRCSRGAQRRYRGRHDAGDARPSANTSTGASRTGLSRRARHGLFPASWRPRDPRCALGLPGERDAPQRADFRRAWPRLARGCSLYGPPDAGIAAIVTDGVLAGKRIVIHAGDKAI